MKKFFAILLLSLTLLTPTFAQRHRRILSNGYPKGATGAILTTKYKNVPEAMKICAKMLAANEIIPSKVDYELSIIQCSKDIDNITSVKVNLFFSQREDSTVVVKAKGTVKYSADFFIGMVSSTNSHFEIVNKGGSGSYDNKGFRTLMSIVNMLPGEKKIIFE
ncbi:MAG: hypothetical protein LKI53_02065 [Bacteroidales bacterium]|jgi:hypothetical protein|nr:hypothetical protein [Bacteroidales bacterium]